jgi:hypothetical protein
MITVFKPVMKKAVFHYSFTLDFADNHQAEELFKVIIDWSKQHHADIEGGFEVFPADAPDFLE